MLGQQCLVSTNVYFYINVALDFKNKNNIGETNSFICHNIIRCKIRLLNVRWTNTGAVWPIHNV